MRRRVVLVVRRRVRRLLALVGALGRGRAGLAQRREPVGVLVQRTLELLLRRRALGRRRRVLLLQRRAILLLRGNRPVSAGEGALSTVRFILRSFYMYREY